MFFKNKETKIASNYVPLTEQEKIARIRNQMNGDFNKVNMPKNIVVEENKNIYRDRINALKNIKKD